jgi:MYXO-CTERM domain-containing protein
LATGAGVNWGACAGNFNAGQCNFDAFGNVINGADVLGTSNGFGGLSGSTTQNDGYYTGLFATLTNSGRGTTNAELDLGINGNTVPEPASLALAALAALALAGAGVVRRRR